MRWLDWRWVTTVVIIAGAWLTKCQNLLCAGEGLASLLESARKAILETSCRCWSLPLTLSGLYTYCISDIQIVSKTCRIIDAKDL
ncbi:unnamed protein product [Rhodiola kirilowii]